MGINADKCCCCCYTLLVVMAVSLSPLNHPLVCAGGVDLTSFDSLDGMSGIALDDNLQANQGDRRGVLGEHFIGILYGRIFLRNYYVILRRNDFF